MGFYENNIDTYIVPSVYVKNILETAGIVQEKIIVIPHFIALDVHEESGVIKDEKKKYAFYGGSLSYEKGTDVLIDIFETLQIPLVLAGTVENNFVPRQSSMVTFLGKQTKEQMFSLMQGAACVVSASTLPETFGLIALEAVSCGKPFFGLQSGAYAEIIINGKNGYLVSNKEMLQKHIADFFQGKTMFDASKIRHDAYECFGEMKYLEAFESLQKRLVKNK